LITASPKADHIVDAGSIIVLRNIDICNDLSSIGITIILVAALNSACLKLYLLTLPTKTIEIVDAVAGICHINVDILDDGLLHCFLTGIPAVEYVSCSPHSCVLAVTVCL